MTRAAGVADLGDDRALVGLGGNLGGSAAVRERFAAAAAAIAGWPDILAVRTSPLYRSAPLGVALAQPRFLNGALELTAARPIEPLALLRRLLALERALGRRRDPEATAQPRTIDLDLLLVGATVRDSDGPPRLALPHPRMTERAFVLIPLADLLGRDAILPQGRALADYLAEPAVAAQLPDLTRDSPRDE